jgi:phosphoenolpyruvate carboxykinase (ATP)
MSENSQDSYSKQLSSIGILNSNIKFNLSSKQLSEISVKKKQAILTSTNAISINTGKFTGRSPEDRFIVEDENTKEHIWWGDINKPFKAEKFDLLQQKVCDYLNKRDELFVRDAFACANEKYKLNIRVVNEYAWSNLFALNMFLRPSNDEKIQKIDWTILNAPGFEAVPKIDGTRQKNFAVINFTKKIIIIGGTGYTGEIKKGIFSALNFILPHDHDVLSMHCSANTGKEGDTAIFFGLSGTGKTTLSADSNRKLIGDDEHGWDDDSIFNFEGGCYAKCIDLSEEKEPDIFNAIKQGALLENIGFQGNSNIVDFSNTEITENTRVSYPIEHISNIAVPSVGKNPKNIFFLTADAFGVLPPISKLSKGQAMYHFISGYTAKVAGTEAGIDEPQTTFSACFGAPFMPLHPTKYAEMLGEKMKNTNVNVWLVNTGWSGGEYGQGKRIKLSYTRSMISAALNGELEKVEFTKHSIFGIRMPESCSGVPSEILSPRNTWTDEDRYDKKANELAKAFIKNFEKFANHANTEILESAPVPK